MLLETFTQAINEFAAVIGYVTIVSSVAYVAAKTVWILIKRKQN